MPIDFLFSMAMVIVSQGHAPRPWYRTIIVLLSAVYVENASELGFFQCLEIPESEASMIVVVDQRCLV